MSQDRWLESYEKENGTKPASSEVVRDPNAMSNNKKRFGAFVTEFERRAKAHKEIYDNYRPIEDIVTKFPGEYETLKGKRQVLNKLADASDAEGSELNKPYSTAWESVHCHSSSSCIELRQYWKNEDYY